MLSISTFFEGKLWMFHFEQQSSNIANVKVMQYFRQAHLNTYKGMVQQFGEYAYYDTVYAIPLYVC